MSTTSNYEKWDQRFLDLAKHISAWSKDPSTQVGAVIVRPNRTIVSVGYNGFPRKVRDEGALYQDRAVKLLRTVHAEANAILTASQSVKGCTLYVSPLHPCANCTGIIIQAGIARVVAYMPTKPHAWEENFAVAQQMFDEARVPVQIVTAEVTDGRLSI
jgi:dCMP deaminase